MGNQKMMKDIPSNLCLSVARFFANYAGNNADRPVLIINNGYRVSRRNLIEESLKLSNRIGHTPHQNWALACDNTAEFITGLLALLAAGKTIHLPANARPGTLKDISQHADALLTDSCGSGFAGEVYSVPELLCTETKKVPVEVNEKLKLTQLVFFTSGSSGTPIAVKKQLWQLENEINALEALWGKQLGQSEILACVSHQHIYGVLFRILWPLLAGRPVDTRLYEYPETLLKKIVQTTSSVIIASPAQLGRLSKDLDWSVSHQRVKAVFSSGAPLEQQSAIDSEDCFSVLPLEVLGSTETGGVAWRQQHGKPGSLNLWQALPGVRVALNNDLLQVWSAWLDDPKAGFVMGDRAELHDNHRFLLKGRADLIVKIEGKRVSLTELSMRLGDSSLVDKAQAVVLDGQRKQIGAVVVLSDSGHKFLKQHGRLNTSRQLKTILSDYFETVTLPRKWRYIPSMPVNSQGKMIRSELVRLFDTGCQDV